MVKLVETAGTVIRSLDANSIKWYNEAGLKVDSSSDTIIRV